jgi:hypothetical protein
MRRPTMDICTPSSVNFPVTLATQQHFEYYCKALFLNTLYVSPVSFMETVLVFAMTLTYLYQHFNDKLI